MLSILGLEADVAEGRATMNDVAAQRATGVFESATAWCQASRPNVHFFGRVLAFFAPAFAAVFLRVVAFGRNDCA